ncbi:MAG: DUF3187 family protein [Gemmatimonadales bacterium]
MTSRLALFLTIAALPAGAAAAQSLPPYLAVNPVVTSRSGVFFQPYVSPARPWQFRILMDYASAIEYTEVDTAGFILDAELLRVDLTAIRNFGTGFVGISSSINGSYGGFLDGFFDWYHELTGLRVAARELRPRNEFLYSARFPTGDSLERASRSLFLGDLRLLAGHRHTRFWQTTAAITLPIAPVGYGRKVPSLAVNSTLRTPEERPWQGEMSLGFGLTGQSGDLTRFQRTAFVGGSAGMRYRFWGRQAAFVNLFWQSANYRNTGMRAFDRRELTLDYGFLLRARKGPEWFFGMTEDLEPKGPALDASFRIGARW